MSTLTKIFIVLMAVFSIAFTMSTINFVAKTNNWRSLAEQYRGQLQVVESNMRNQAAAQAAEKTAWLDARNDLQRTTDDLRKESESQLAQIAEMRNQLAKVETEKNTAMAQATRLASELTVANNGWLEQRKEREGLEQRNMELERRNLDLSERVNEQTAQILVLVQQQNQLEQQINILREERSRTSQTGGPVTGRYVPDEFGGVSAAAPPASTPIRGHIVEVQGNIATISVGSADGVREGSVFVIYRGPDYVGDLKVTDVEPNLSAGRIIRSRSTPRPNDQVADEPALGMAQ